MKQFTTLDEIYEQAKAARVVLTLDEFAKKIGTSRATLYRFKKNPESIPYELIQNAKCLISETQNVSRETKDKHIYNASPGEYHTRDQLEIKYLKQKIQDLERIIESKDELILSLKKEAPPKKLGNVG